MIIISIKLFLNVKYLEMPSSQPQSIIKIRKLNFTGLVLCYNSNIFKEDLRNNVPSHNRKLSGEFFYNFGIFDLISPRSQETKTGAKNTTYFFTFLSDYFLVVKCVLSSY